MAELSSEEFDVELRVAVQREVVHRLGVLKDPRALRRLLSHVNADYVTVELLLRFGEAAVPELVQALHPACALDADKALRTLIKLGPNVLPALRTGIPPHPSPLASRCAIASCHLGVFEEELIPPVILAVERDWSRSLALVALARLADRFQSPLLRTAIPVLQNLARSWRLARTLSPSENGVDPCREVLIRIERATDGLKSMPIVASAAVERDRDLPIVSHPPERGPDG
jgi:hypothetical protein